MMQKHIVLSCCVLEEQDSFSEGILKNHRITEWFGSEGAWKIISFHPLLYPGTPSTRSGPRGQVAQSSIQPEHFQGCCVRKCSLWCQLRKDRWGLFAVASPVARVSTHWKCVIQLLCWSGEKLKRKLCMADKVPQEKKGQIPAQAYWN